MLRVFFSSSSSVVLRNLLWRNSFKYFSCPSKVCYSKFVNSSLENREKNVLDFYLKKDESFDAKSNRGSFLFDLFV